MKLSKILFFLALTSIITACGGNKAKQPKLPTLNKVSEQTAIMKDIQMTRWELTDYTYKKLTKAVIGTKKVYIILRDGKLSGFTSCSSFVGKYSEGENSTLQFSDIQAPQKNCKGLAGQESIFLALIRTATEYKISESGNQMMINSLEGNLRFTSNK